MGLAVLIPTILSAGKASAGPSPVALLRKAQDNASKIYCLDMTITRESTTTGPAAGTKTIVQRFLFCPGKGTAEIDFIQPVSNLKWVADLSASTWTVIRGGAVESVRSLPPQRVDQPALAQFSPLGLPFMYPSLFGKLALKSAGTTTIDGAPAEIIYAGLAEYPSAGMYELTIEPTSGRIRRARSIQSTGFVTQDVAFNNYQKVQGVWIPMSVTEQHFATNNSVSVGHHATSIVVTRPPEVKGGGDNEGHGEHHGEGGDAR